MLNSKQILEITAISRATLNNYVALGILPNPVIRTPGENEGRATRLGYFDDAAVQRIQQVQLLKKQGMSMAHIAKELSTPKLQIDRVNQLSTLWLEPEKRGSIHFRIQEYKNHLLFL